MGCGGHIPVPIFSQLPPHLPSSSCLPSSHRREAAISQYQLEMWWMTGGGRENRAPQSPSGSLSLPISLPFSPALGQPPWSHTYTAMYTQATHTHTLEFCWPGQWWIPNLAAAGWSRRLRSEWRKRPPRFISLRLQPFRPNTLLYLSSPAVRSRLMLQEELS